MQTTSHCRPTQANGGAKRIYGLTSLPAAAVRLPVSMRQQKRRRRRLHRRLLQLMHLPVARWQLPRSWFPHQTSLLIYLQRFVRSTSSRRCSATPSA